MRRNRKRLPLRAPETRSERAVATLRMECNAETATRKGFVGVDYKNKISRLVITVEYGGAL
jgi:hypothetical protein